MLNLLPPDIKRDYRYARRNVSLRKWLVVFVVALVGLGGIATYGLLSLHQSTVSLNQQISSTESQFQHENFAGTEAEVQNISNSFRLVVKVLGQEVLFSQLIKRIGSVMPTGTSLTGLTINQLQGGLDITAEAANYDDASQIQVNLADPSNKIFSKADIETITYDQPTGEYKVTLRALFAPNNPFLFINSKVAP